MTIDLWALMGPTLLISFLVPVLITILIVGVIVYALRRNVPPAEDPAVAELRGRLARGEIDPSEFQARLDALQRDT